MKFLRWCVLTCCVIVLVIAPSVRILAQQGERVPITAENAAQVAEIGRLGDGSRWITDISPDGQTVAMAGSLGLWLYDLTHSEAEPRLLDNPHRAARQAVYSPDGSLLAVGYSTPNFTVDIWDVASETVIQQVTHEDFVEGLSWSPDGRQIAVGGGVDRWVRVWDVASRELISSVNVEPEEGYSQEIVDVDFLDATTIAISLDYGAVMRWDTSQDGAELREADAWLSGLDRITGLTLSDDGRLLSRAAWNETVPIFDVESGEQLVRLEGHTDDVLWVDFSPDGLWVTTASRDGTFKVWSVESGQQIVSVNMHEGELVWFAGFTPDSQQIIVDGYGRMATFDLSIGQTTVLSETSIYQIRQMALSLDGSLVATTGYSDVVTIRSTATGEVIHTLDGHSATVESIAFSRDGTLLATGGGYLDQKVGLWDVASGELLGFYRGHEHAVTSVTFSADGRAIIAGSQVGSVRWWDIETGDTMELAVGTGIFYVVALSHDGTMLLAATNSAYVVIIDMQSHEVVFSSAAYELGSGFRGGAWSPDGSRVILAGSDSVIYIIDIESQSVVGTLTGHVGPVEAVAFSPDGSLIASVGGLFDASLRLWDATNGDLLAEYIAHTIWAGAVAFSEDGALLVTGSSDETVRMWGVVE